MTQTSFSVSLITSHPFLSPSWPPGPAGLGHVIGDIGRSIVIVSLGPSPLNGPRAGSTDTISSSPSRSTFTVSLRLESCARMSP
eukprot:CAMPEP_0171061606 /NCGR_PEP_ID=MMETSP0766_2-20121228/4548_1 /TAXON_ID=439317 /ORGANISM="Gambierdiscus australes, Strain CAWD 149" /LENGTH=83 /DNA_ID=CAMNT_0011517311 /DNA_START=182 /DNA_END=436 /DNA_ORIENTATION=+